MTVCQNDKNPGPTSDYMFDEADIHLSHGLCPYNDYRFLIIGTCDTFFAF